MLKSYGWVVVVVVVVVAHVILVSAQVLLVFDSRHSLIVTLYITDIVQLKTRI